jgi:oxygen-independent coproporphyrinogen-3 oxidase
MEALRQQAEAMAAHPWARASSFRSLYIGGGTPSIVAAGKMATLVAALIEMFDFSPGPGREPEVTMEANPNSVTAAMLDRLRQAGVNRLSIGVQSFSDALLQNIGRAHSGAEAAAAVKLARTAGFANISLDLMYGLPGQDSATWEETLRMAVDLRPAHISAYELTIEGGTPFAALAGQGKLALPGEEETLAMFAGARKILAAGGYSHYEISNYARAGFACSHNVNYWENNSYLGLGSSAVSCFSGVRLKNEENPDRFTAMVHAGGLPFIEGEFLPLGARFRETVIMGLRMTAGVSIARLEQQFGMTPGEHYGRILQELLAEGMVQEEGGRLRLTEQGLLLANRVMAQLV